MARSGFSRERAGEALAKRVRLLLLIPRLSGGGSQRVMTLLAKNLSRERYEIHLGLVTTAESERDALPPWVRVHRLGARRVRWSALSLLRLVWRLRPRMILSGATEVSFLTLLLRPLFPRGTRILVRQNTTLSAAVRSGRAPGGTRWLSRLLYRRADRVICQSRAMAEDLMGELQLSQEQIAVLPNLVDLAETRAKIDESIRWRGAGPHLLAVGRLSHEKGFDLLLKALAKVRERFAGADLIIAGAGCEEASLRSLCRALHLEDAVHFAGYVDHPHELFPGATVFVLASRYEGMPNALLEAAAAGLPIVTTPASVGIVDLLRDQPGAWLTPAITAEVLAETLISALDALRPGQRFHYEYFPSMSQQNDEAERCSADGAELQTTTN